MSRGAAGPHPHPPRLLWSGGGRGVSTLSCCRAEPEEQVGGQLGAGGSLSWPDVSFFPCRLSFYSGHSSFGMYCMMFLAVSATGRR